MSGSLTTHAAAAALLTALLAVPCLSAARAAGPQIVVDADTGVVIAASGADVSWHPASLTKLMTAHLALLAVEAGRLSMASPVTVSAAAAAQPPSRLGLSAGTRLTLLEAMTAMLVRSSNDMAVVVAEAVAGSEGPFVALMNREAKELGMTATRFADANGLDDGRQVTTARDMAVLSLAVLKRHPAYAGLFSVKSATVQGKAIRNTNGLLGKDGVDGMKTGYVCASGFNIVATAKRNGRRLLAVVLGEGSSRRREAAAARLLDFGFSRPSGGPRLSAYAASEPRPAMNLKPFACGRNWKGLKAPSPPQAENGKTEGATAGKPRRF